MLYLYTTKTLLLSPVILKLSFPVLRMREKVGLKVVKALKRNDSGVKHAALDMLCALMQPMHDEYDLRQEQLNKTSLLSSQKFLKTLLEMFNEHVVCVMTRVFVCVRAILSWCP